MVTMTAERSRSGAAETEGVVVFPPPPAELEKTAEVGVWILWGVMPLVAGGVSTVSPGPAARHTHTTPSLHHSGNPLEWEGNPHGGCV